MATIEKIFNNLDLPKKSVAVYDFIIKNGPISASNIAKYLNMPRATVYLYLDELLKYNIISTFGSYKKRKYIAENPQKITELLNDKAEKIKSIIPDAQKMAEEMIKNLFLRKYAVPTVRYYIGKEGVRNIIWSTLNCKSKTIYGIISIYNIYEILGEEFLLKYTNERIKKKLKVKNIWPEGEMPKILSQHKEQLRDVRFSDVQKDFKASFWAYDDYVIIVTSKEELLTIQIGSHDLAQAIKALFELIWVGALS